MPTGSRITAHTAPRARAAVALAAATTLALTLAGCAGEVAMEPADDANNPRCAEVTVRLPRVIGELEKRTTNAQATGAWGDPTAVMLRCGIEPSGPTADTCVSVNGVDWVIDRSRAPLYRFEAYGRSPGLEVIVHSERASGTEAVTALENVAKLLPQERRCTSISEELELD